MFVMRPKALDRLDSVFVGRVLGVFVPNLVILLNVRPSQSCEDSAYSNAQCFFGPIRTPFALVKLLSISIVSLNSLAK